ncbi:MAG: DNA recombination protein RmuC [Chloroflexota bacterium]|nr:DNA recombination protein RmuC [Chloroflexota bacterium]MDE2885965.1 DNA recombination protein RmuC [Chloroflexota bacterium]
MEVLIALVVGLVVGGIASWLVKENLMKARVANSAADAAKKETAHLETIARLEGQLQEIDNADKILAAAKEQLSDAFKATAARALQDNNELFVNVAKENLGKTLESAKGEFKQRHEQFQKLVEPLSQHYQKLTPQIESLIRQSQALTSETGKLSNALTNNRQIGNWGEIQLRRVVELAGMMEHCDFVEQTTINDAAERPDLMVHLPENRTIVVDAKASTAAYLEAQEIDDETQASKAMQRHASALRSQVDDLARKDYGGQVEGSLDFVVMFVPADQFLIAALSANPNLIEYAMGKRVVIATPSSLIALLWAVANGWRRYQIAENIETIRKVGEEMHDRMLKFIQYYESVGKRLQSAVDAYNRSVSSFDSRVVPQGRRFAQLVKSSEEDFGQPILIDRVVSTSNYAQAPGQLPKASE